MTDRRLRPQEDRSLPSLYCIGNTNIVSRPSKDAAELSKEELAAGTADLDAKFLKYKPEAVLIVGKGIWESIWRYRYGRNPKASEFQYGWQDEKHNMGKSEEGAEDVDANGQVYYAYPVPPSQLNPSSYPEQPMETASEYGEYYDSGQTQGYQAPLPPQQGMPLPPQPALAPVRHPGLKRGFQRLTQALKLCAHTRKNDHTKAVPIRLKSNTLAHVAPYASSGVSQYR